MGCCDDPTQPEKINRNDWVLLQEKYGNLQRDLFTSDPEKVMLKQLQICNAYLRELAALHAHFDSVRKQAITLLDDKSSAVLKRIAEQEGDNEIGELARQRLIELEKGQEPSLLGRLFHH